MPDHSSAPSRAALLHPQAVISRTALRHNLRVLTQRAGAGEVMAVVKADAYGHGAEQVAALARAEGVRWLAVATVEEGRALREAGAEERILVFAAPLPEHLPAYQALRLDVTASSLALVHALAEWGDTNDPIRAHLKIDTGMGRIGIEPEEAKGAITSLREAAGVELAGVWTHLATSEDEDPTFTTLQLNRFREALSGVDTGPALVHWSNSGAAYGLPADGRGGLLRAGIALYGHGPTVEAEQEVHPAMQFIAPVVHVKTVEPGTAISYGRTWTAPRRTRIATVRAGYADGYPRLASNRGKVGVAGGRVPVVGRVCMDALMIDIGPEGEGPEVKLGDPVVLFGEGGPSATELAGWAETIPYEICCRVSARVPRVYAE